MLGGIKRIEAMLDSNMQPNVPKPDYPTLYDMIYNRSVPAVGLCAFMHSCACRAACALCCSVYW